VGVEGSQAMSGRGLVEEGFTIKHFKGLGNAFMCKLCGATFVGVTDALRHMMFYHRIVTVGRLRWKLEEA